jgi:diacylglycerol O-acyltransferase / wax synthase
MTMAGRRGRLDRLTPLDMSNLRVEEHGLSMHVAALVVLEPAEPGQPDLDRLRGIVEGRLSRVPRLRQVIYRPPPGLGSPVWVDARDFDIRQHVQVRPVPKPGDEAALLRACTELDETPLDRSRPLWQMWLLTGLAGGRRALLIRLHHVVADGIAALAMLGSLIDPAPGTEVPDPPPWTPAPAPGVVALASDQLRRQTLLLRHLAVRLRHPRAAVTRLGVLARQARQVAREGRAPRVSLNVPVTGPRQLLLIRADLRRAKAVAHAHGGTVNDVVLAAVAGGARSLLRSRGELTPGLVLKASVAASVRDPADRSATGNRVGLLVVPLPAAEADPERCLAAIAAATASRKTLPPYRPAGRLAQRWMAGVMARQRLVNLLVSNLPGPPGPLRLGGARVLEIFQMGVVQGNLTVSVGAISYAGQLNLDVVADSAAVPDAGAFAGGISDTLGQLGVLVMPITQDVGHWSSGPATLPGVTAARWHESGEKDPQR